MERGKAPSGSGVLQYLRSMIEYCRLEHRPDIQAEYEEAWRLAASKLYGPLPDRWQSFIRRQSVHLPNCPEEEKKPAPPWRQQMLAKPMRKVVRTYTETHKADPPLRFVYTDTYLVLECGHTVLDATMDPDAPPAKRRRCGECRDASAKKQPASAPTSKEGKIVSA